jgi:ribose-phosphate pyrophosphokinase
MFVEHFKNIQNTKNINDFIVVSPDAGGAKFAKSFADKLGVNLAIMHKSRPKHNQAEISEVVGDVKGKTCIFVDDMVDTAGTICAAKDALAKYGANPEVYLCATHAIFSGPAIERLNNANFEEIVITDSIPLQGEVNNINVLSASSLLANIIRNTLDQKSVSELF